MSIAFLFFNLPTDLAIKLKMAFWVFAVRKKVISFTNRIWLTDLNLALY